MCEKAHSCDIISYRVLKTLLVFSIYSIFSNFLINIKTACKMRQDLLKSYAVFNTIRFLDPLIRINLILTFNSLLSVIRYL